MRSSLMTIVALGLTLAVASSAFAQTSKQVKSVWGKAIKNGSLVEKSGMKLAPFGLSSEAKARVKAAVKLVNTWGMPYERTTQTLAGKSKTAKSTFGVFTFTPGFGDDFVAKRVTKVFDRSGNLLGTHRCIWDQHGLATNGWDKTK